MDWATFWAIFSQTLLVTLIWILRQTMCSILSLLRKPKNKVSAGLPDIYFQTKITNLGKFWRVLQWKTLVYFVAICYIYGHLVYFYRFGMLYLEKSGNPE
jgi:hypothetical protein